MTRKLRNGLILALTIAALALGDRALALSFDDIAGKWCGSVSSYAFTPTTLTVTLYSDNSKRDYPIDSYQYEGDVVTVNWRRGDEKLFTKFSEFNADQRTMVQLQNNAGPRREFRKCSE